MPHNQGQRGEGRVGRDGIHVRQGAVVVGGKGEEVPVEVQERVGGFRGPTSLDRSDVVPGVGACEGWETGSNGRIGSNLVPKVHSLAMVTIERLSQARREGGMGGDS